MSIKDLFKKNYQSKVVTNKSLEEIGSEIESANYVEGYIKSSEEFIPDVDFSNPSNFVFYGSAEKYYGDSIKRIIQTYPFDGSAREKIEWHNSSSFLDKYLFENEYPRTNGYARFTPTGSVSSSQSGDCFGNVTPYEYIQIKGGPHTGPSGSYVGANIYDTGSLRTSNLYFNPNIGNTIEFWLKKGAIVTGSTKKEVIFDLYNGETVAYSSTSSYGRFLIYLDGTVSPAISPIKVTCVSGNVYVAANISIGSTTASANNIFDDVWNHYAITVKNSSDDLVIKLYLNGELDDVETVSYGAIGEITGALIANIGALRAKTSPFESPASSEGYGKLSGSLDEFRFWKRARTSKQIGRYWFSQVNGGTNVDTANVDLGVYYKFNEGIVGTSSIDSIVLDYSGRLSHGNWVGYNSYSRSTGSAIVDSGVEVFEFRDPILYSSHPLVRNFTSNKRLTGSAYDITNNSSIYNSLPAWVVEEDEKKSGEQLKNLTQIMASFFDETQLKIQELNKLKDIRYVSGSNSRANPFASRLLENAGFIAPEIFVDASIISQLFARDEKRLFKKNLYNIKNIIYQNIYNNLNYIYKSKGTEKAFRNLIRCFGIDDELIKINLYGNNITHEFKDNFKSLSVRKKYVDFNDVDRFSATVYQKADSNNPDSMSYISGSLCPLMDAWGLAVWGDEIWGGNYGYEQHIPITVECEVIFPKKFSQDLKFFFDTPFVTASLFGMHTAKTSSSDLTWGTTDISNFEVYAVRDRLESKDAYFVLTSSYGGPIPLLTSSLFKDVYNNSKWNFAVRVKPSTFPLVERVSGTELKSYDFEFYGVQKVLDTTINEFSVTASVNSGSGCGFVTNPKRLYCGAHRTNFTGSVLNRSDVKISSLRYWMNYLTDEVIKFHAKDATNLGSLHPYRNSYLNVDWSNKLFIPELETRILDWDFATVTASGPGSGLLTNDAQFIVEDISSGSLDIINRYNWFGQYCKRQYTGCGDFFIGNDSDVVSKEYVLTAKQKLPETIDSSDMIEILDRDDDVFTRETRPINYFFAFEKSMYQTISEEMINIFATIKDFNNLIGEPVNRYRQEYKELGKLRELFFEKVGNVPDFEKYVEFYKWIDSALSIMLQELSPASANISDEIRTVIESHLFERNKYWTKYPTFENKLDIASAGMQGINRHLYNWASGSAPIGLSQAQHNTWWKERAERNKYPLSINDGLDNSRTKILSASLQVLERSWTTPLRTVLNIETTASKGIHPVRFKNVKIVYSHSSPPWTNPSLIGTASYSASIPNYTHDYEIVQTSGRTINNKALVASASLLDFNLLQTSSYILGLTDTPKMRMGNNKYIFVERFSAPGGPDTAGDTDGGPGLDPYAGEYSVYNNLNYRNLLSRIYLNNLAKSTMGQFGVDTSISSVRELDYNTSASYYKINRNPLRRIRIDATGPYYTSSIKDNWYIQHAIPQEDTGYRWISASFISAPFGSAQTKDEIIFVSGSDFVGVDFVGMNYHIYEPITSSQNMVGYPQNISNYVNSNFINGVQTASLFNSIMLHRNGPYEYPMWKQTRTSQHPVARYQRNNNIFSIIKPTEEVVRVKNNQRAINKPLRDKIINYVEPVLSKRFYPIVHELISDDGEENNLFAVEHAYGNNLITFANVELANRLGSSFCSAQVYDKIVKTINEKDSVIKQFVSLLYRENIFPREINSFLEKSRKRKYFTFDNFWRDERKNRNKLQYQNSQGDVLLLDSNNTALSHSIWPLDARNNFETANALSMGLISSLFIGDGNYEGELQNSYTTFKREESGNDFGNFRNGAILHRRVPEYTSSPPTPGGLTGSRVFAGDTKWTAPTERNRNPAYDTYEKYANDVFYSGKEYSIIPEFRISEHMDTYVDSLGGNFLKDKNDFLSLTGSNVSNSGQSQFFKTYSHSDFLKYFGLVKSDHDEVGKPTKLKLTCKAKLKFLPYKGFYPADRTLQLATLFSQSYGDYVNPAGYNSGSNYYVNRLKWRSFLSPFFGPGILYNSIKSGVAVDYPIYAGDTWPTTRHDINAGNTGGPHQEGIYVFNSDFDRRLPFESLVEPENYLTKAKIWDMNPEHSASIKTDLTNDATNQASMWGGQGSEKYKLAMHNFLAEVPNFFLKNSNFTTLISKAIPKEGITITPQQANKYFGMDVYIANSQVRNLTEWLSRRHLPEFSTIANIGSFVNKSQIQDVKGIHTQMYSRDSAFGPPWVQEHTIFTDPTVSSSYHYGYEPFTPSYFNGFGLVRYHFYPFKGAGKYTLDEIQSNLTASCIRMPSEKTGSYACSIVDRLLEWQTLLSCDKNVLESGSSVITSPSGRKNVDYYARAVYSASLNWQHINSSFNLLMKTKTKKNIYSVNENGEYVPETFEDDVNSDEYWVIQPKWETPVLNFKNKIPTAPTSGQGTLSVAKGMWHQYGSELTKDEGIWLGVNDIPDTKLRGFNFDIIDQNHFLNRNVSERFVETKKKNAEIKILIRDAGVLHAGMGIKITNDRLNYTTVISGSNGVGISSDVIFKPTAGNFATAVRIANAINTNNNTKNYFTASAFLVDLADTPWSEKVPNVPNTDYVESDSGLVSGGMDPAGVVIRIKDVAANISEYPKYFASGEEGNKIKAEIANTVDFPFSWHDESGASFSLDGRGSGEALPRDSSVLPVNIDYFDSNEIWTLAGQDENGNPSYTKKEYFYGGHSGIYDVESLADLVGFQKTQRRIGNTAEEKQIKEAIVAVPFVEKNGQKKFFNLPRYQIDNILNNRKLREGQIEPGQSIIDMVQKMKDYIFPPKMDFITNRTVRPYACYVFEFEHTLKKQDLYDIWQNLMPDIGISFKEQQSTIEHVLLENELLKGKVEDTLRWMVFKVKQRAEKNYFAKTADSSDDSRFKFNFEIGDKSGGKYIVPDYSYNWPYDFFSLVELAKIEAEVKIEANPEKVDSVIDDKGAGSPTVRDGSIVNPSLKNISTVFDKPSLSSALKDQGFKLSEKAISAIKRIK